MTNSRFTNSLRRVPTAGWAVVASILLQVDCLAQSNFPLIQPAPLGSPGVPVGPIPNPFGTPPAPIGTVPSPYIQNSYPSPFFAPPPYFGPPVAYPMIPYEVRRPSPFDPAGSYVVPGSYVAPTGPTGFGDRKNTSFSAATIEPLPSTGNLRLSISENFLNRFIARDESKPGEVRDFILGAQVSGRQTTVTRLRLDLLPAADKARGMLVLNGMTESATTGVTAQASVDVASHQDFVAVKELFYDGNTISTRHAVVTVRANNQNLGAVTPLTGTLFGGIANRIALREAERRRPAAEAIARDRVADRVYPEFDTSIDRQLASANDQLELVVRRKLKESNLMPSMQQVSSTDTCLNYSALVATETTPATNPPSGNQIPGDSGVSLAIHESLLNAVFARSGLSGFKTTDRQLRDLCAPYEIKSKSPDTDRDPPPLALPGMENVVTDIEFDKKDPLSIRIERDQTLMTLRAKFRPAGQDILPPLSVTIGYRTELTADKIIVIPGKVQVSLQDQADVAAGTSIALKLVSQMIETDLTKLGFDRSVPASIWSVGGLVPRVTGIRSQDGWATITID